MDINQIAQLAGVSRATVSRYLNDGYVSQEKRAAIARVIKETGYVPSQYAKSLRTGKSNVVGVIIPKINSASVSRMVAGMTTVLNGGDDLLAEEHISRRGHALCRLLDIVLGHVANADLWIHHLDVRAWEEVLHVGEARVASNGGEAELGLLGMSPVDGANADARITEKRPRGVGTIGDAIGSMSRVDRCAL